MNKSRGVLGLCAVSFGLAACAPLEQAPLIYVSKTSAGFDISGTSTESPGVSIVVGFKQVDAAYVPVMVGRPCDAKEAKCDGQNFRLERIEGGHTAENTSGPSQPELRENVEKYEKAAREAADSEKARDAFSQQLTTQRQRLTSLTAKDKAQKEKLADLGKLQGALTPGQPVEAEMQKKLDAVEKDARGLALTAEETETLKILPAQIKDLENSLKQATAKASEDRSKANSLKAAAEQARQLLGLSRKDAYSAYGRFESSSGVGKEDASLGLGKTFSTGVAAQNLTDGIGKYYAALALQACFEAVLKLASVTNADTAKTEQAFESCRKSSAVSR